MIKCPCQIKSDWWFLFFSENHLITLPIISHDQELWNDIKKQPCSFPFVCVCFKERNEESVIYDEKKRSIIKQGANHFCIWGVTLKSVHFKNKVARSSLLSKALIFLFWFQRKWQHFWKKWGLRNCLLKMNKF